MQDDKMAQLAINTIRTLSMDAVQAAGTRMAFPSQTTYLVSDSPFEEMSLPQMLNPLVEGLKAATRVASDNTTVLHKLEKSNDQA